LPHHQGEQTYELGPMFLHNFLMRHRHNDSSPPNLLLHTHTKIEHVCSASRTESAKRSKKAVFTLFEGPVHGDLVQTRTNSFRLEADDRLLARPGRAAEDISLSDDGLAICLGDFQLDQGKLIRIRDVRAPEIALTKPGGFIVKIKIEHCVGIGCSHAG